MNKSSDSVCEIIKEINIICEKMKKNEQLFDLADSDDLIEAVIYEQKALQARYTFLIKKARETGVICDISELL